MSVQLSTVGAEGNKLKELKKQQQKEKRRAKAAVDDAEQQLSWGRDEAASAYTYAYGVVERMAWWRCASTYCRRGGCL